MSAFSLLIVWSSLFTTCFAITNNCSINPLYLPWSNITIQQNGPAITRGIEIFVGTPAQIFSLRPTTTLNDTFLWSLKECLSETNSTCIGGIGGVYDSSVSTTFLENTQSSWNGSNPNDEDISDGSLIYFNDVLNLGDNQPIFGFPLILDTAVKTDGQNGLPLGSNSSFLEGIVANSLAPSTSWGLWAGDRSLSPVDGALVVGGFDAARVAGNFSSYPIKTPTPELPCPFQVTIANINYNTPDGISHSLLANDSEQIVACIEPYEDSLKFPSEITSNFLNVTGYNESYPLLTYPVADIPSGNLTIIFDNGYTTNIPNSELFTLKRGSNAEGQYAVINASIVQAELVTRTSNTPTYLSGLFLTFNYLVVNYQSGIFQLAPAVEGSQSTEMMSLTTLCDSNDTGVTEKTRMSEAEKGKIAGGTISGILIAVVGGLVIWYLRRQKLAEKKQSFLPGDTS